MKYLRFVIIGLVLTLPIVTIYLSGSKYFSCQVFYRPDVTIQTPVRPITAEAARSPAEHEKGLSGRECIGRNKAMLFFHQEPGQFAYWMKDMKFSIDILWIGADKKVVKLKTHVSPDTFPNKFTNDEPAMYVLELGAGEAARLGLTKGTQINF
ncbi:DUF192 domain-containing protein [Candidatus Saccharibacteria bacterium]|nr:DUF192 domain-containing protein [Candidatus Saccharibacteria bacterium]